MHPAGTPGNAMTIVTSCSSSNTSIGGSHTACVRSDEIKRKNCRCMRSACSIRAQACDHIQYVGLRDDIEIPGDKPGPVGRKSQFWHPWSSSHKANYEGKSSRFKLLCRR